MKKIKIMLLSLALFAVVGGALAFKARFQVHYCTSTIVDPNNAPICPNLVTSTTVNGITSYWTTLARFDADQQTFVCTDVNGNVLNCVAKTKLVHD